MTAATPAVEAPALTILPDVGARAIARTFGGRTSDWASDVLLLDDGGTLVVGTANNTGPSHRITPGNARLIRTDAEGNIVWEKDFGVQMRMRMAFGEGMAPVLANGRLVLVFDHEGGSFMVVLDAKTGKELWRAARDEKKIHPPKRPG